MKTTINLDNELLAKAPRLIHMGLEALIQRSKLSFDLRRYADTPTRFSRCRWLSSLQFR
jgi:hypothetical protein